MKRVSLLLTFLFLLTGCASNASQESTNSPMSSTEDVSAPETHVLAGEIRVFSSNLSDFPFYTWMLDGRPNTEEMEDICGIELPSNHFKDVDFSLALPGDRFIAKWQGADYELMLSCPGQLGFIGKVEGLSSILDFASILEVDIKDGKVLPIDGYDFSSLFVEKAINKQKEYVPLSSISKGFATISKAKPGVARAIFTYNPRPEIAE